MLPPEELPAPDEGWTLRSWGISPVPLRPQPDPGPTGEQETGLGWAGLWGTGLDHFRAALALTAAGALVGFRSRGGGQRGLRPYQGAFRKRLPKPPAPLGAPP